MIPEKPYQKSPSGGDSFQPSNPPPAPGDESGLVPADLLDDILAAFSDYGILVLDAEGCILYANSGAQAIYGYPKSELFGRSARDILETPSLAETEHLEDLLTQSNESGRLEFDLPQERKTGEVFPARVRFHPCHRQTGATIVLISELETQVGIEQLKRDFLSLVSHELRTPLTSIKGASSMLHTGALGELSPEQQRFLGIIDRNCERLNHLIASLLDLTRLEAGRLRLRRASVNVDKLLREAERHVGEQYASKQIELQHVESPEPVHVHADPARLEQVLLSLLDNAFKFTPNEGRVRTAITATEKEVVIEVSDSGIGIPAEEQGRIFEKFYQVDFSLTRAAGGAGLGLYMARRLIKAHRGRIWVKSAPGQGSSFCVALPRMPS